MLAPLHRHFHAYIHTYRRPCLLYQTPLPLMDEFSGIHQIISLFQEMIQSAVIDTVCVGANAGMKFIFLSGYFIIFTDSLFNAANNLPRTPFNIPARQGNQKLLIGPSP